MAPARPPAPPHSRNSLRTWLRILVASCVLIGAVSMGTVAGVLASTFQVITQPRTRHLGPFHSDVGESQEAVDPITMFERLDRRMNILVMGSDYNYSYGKKVTGDATSGNTTRSDTMMLMGIDPQRNSINILSIPRDTRTLVNGSYEKINAALSYGGIDLAKRVVTDLTGVPIDHHMALKIDGLIKLVDLIGGVSIYVDRDMYYVDETAHLGINIHKGWKNMNGEQAHQYVRFRKDELGDIGRVQRQQKFIQAVVSKMMNPLSWFKVPQLLAHAQEHIDTDIPMPVLGQIARFAKGLDKDRIRMVMLPGYFSGSEFQVSYWLVNYEASRDILKDMFPDSAFNDPQQSPVASVAPDQSFSRYRVSLWNGTNDYQLGQRVIGLLREAGWNVWAVRKSPHDALKTQYIAQTGKAELLRDIQTTVGFNGERVNASTGDIATDFTVLIGEDLKNHFDRLDAQEKQRQQETKQQSQSASPTARRRER